MYRHDLQQTGQRAVYHVDAGSAVIPGGTTEIYSLSAACMNTWSFYFASEMRRPALGGGGSERRGEKKHLQSSGHLEALRFLSFSSRPDDLPLVVHHHLRGHSRRADAE